MTSPKPSTRFFTPEFGVCLDVETQTANRCVLSEASCEAGNEVYRAPYESDQSCTNPGGVVVGRCESSLDDKRCAPTLASCGTKMSFYSPNDPTCSLLADGNRSLEDRTTFPACRNPGSDSWHCVLDGDYCTSDERLAYSKWAAEWGPEPCHCEDVPTGVCYQTATAITDSNGLTRTNSFCAVSSRDCPITHEWMSARAFLESERATYQCRLCDDPNNNRADSYLAGACRETHGSSPPSYVSCAMESTDCASETTEFVSAPRLLKDGWICPVESTENWGECQSTGDLIECTNKADSCLYDFRFTTNPSECSIYGNSKTGMPTYFSYCAPRTDNDDRDWKDIRCVWDQSECETSNERWEEARLPNAAWFRGCRCEDVVVGACEEPSTGEYHCAVSAQACTDPSLYVPQRLLAERNIALSCTLCNSRPRTPVPTPFPSSLRPPESPPSDSPAVSGSVLPRPPGLSPPTAFPVSPTPLHPENVATTGVAATNAVDQEENLQRGMIILLSPLLVLLVFIGAYYYICSCLVKRKRYRVELQTSNTSDPTQGPSEGVRGANNDNEAHTSFEVDHVDGLVSPVNHDDGLIPPSSQIT